MAGPLTPLIIAAISFIAKEGIKAATKKYGKEAVREAASFKKLRTKYQKTVEADNSGGEDNDRNFGVSKAKVTRSQNALSKAINEHLGPDASIQDKINLRTMLQDNKFNKGGLTKKKKTAGYNKGGMIDYRKTGMFK